ncbi:hypothetical protein [Brevibacterium jeotgali]|uniref:Uncharacterized protein n=1 Tax=Brevibacterium jeotgali TaxID=1262550 RepID=A0A2H1L8C3_9MICO|nr:hypothetical protein [Brevibacterium jeotgali]SMY13148.1 hypothetical protein BJEO58_02758 [Brevibacterium jeotgali]
MNPIPGFEDLGAGSTGVPETISLTRAVKSGEKKTLGVAWLTEPFQVDIELLAQMQETGIAPGTVMKAEPDGDYISNRADGSSDVPDLPSETTASVFVTR